MKRTPQPADHEELEAFVAEYGMRIYRFCWRLTGNQHDAEDLSQEVFLAAHRQMDRFAGRSSISTYLYRIAVFKHRAKTRRFESRNVSLSSLDTQPVHDESATHALRLTLQNALKDLPPLHREAFLLVKVEGLSCAEAAKVQRVPVGTLKFRVHRAVHQLQQILDDSIYPVAREGSNSPKEAFHAL